MRFKARSPGTAVLVEQMKSFPLAAHEDAVDCTEMARRLAIKLIRKGKR
jgi:hypothetical protein